MLTTTVAGQAAVLTNAWPQVPLYPSIPLQPLNQTKPAANVPANIVKSNNPAQPIASTTSVRSWPAALPSSKSNSIPPIDPPATLPREAVNPIVTTTSNASTNLDASGAVNLDDSHRLEPGDNISFQILEDKKDTYADKKDPVHLSVTDSSEVDFPYVGRISVADKTCQQVAAELKTLLEKDYYYQATVVIGLDSINKVRGRAFVCGLVRTQGSVDILFNHDITAGEAILMMGGLDDFADKKQVKVIRNHDNGGTTNQQIFVVNMQDVLERGQIDKDIVLQPGDFVIVPARVLNF
jgi:polysaccharide export outer membrane protein